MIPRAGTAESWRGAAGLNADHALIAGCGHVFEAGGSVFSHCMRSSTVRICFSMAELDRGICFWIAANLHDGQSFFCEGWLPRWKRWWICRCRLCRILQF